MGAFVLFLYGIEEKCVKGIDNGRHSLFCESDMWPRDFASNPLLVMLKYGIKQSM